MKTKILLAFCCLLSIASFSQDSIFQLKDYKYRTKGFRALELQSSLTGQTDNYKQGSSPTQKNSLIDLYPSYLNYTNISSTDKRFHTSFISLSPSFRSHVEGDGQNKVKGNNYQARLTWNFDDRFYRKNNWFLRLANNLYSRDEFTKEENIQSVTKTTLPGVDESLLLGFGKGRLEMIQDAQMALFILNDLKDEGLLTTLPNAALVNEFAQLITEINNRRVFDSRKKRIFELTQIDKFLREKGLASTTDIRHFTIINDNWALAFNAYRRSGSSWSLNLKPFAQIGKSRQTVTAPNFKTINESEAKLFGIGPNLSYENQKPINLKWQRGLGVSLSWQLARSEQKSKYVSGNTSQDNTLNTNQQFADFSAFYAIGFYPNNRTVLNASLGIDAVKQKYTSGLPGNQIFLHPSFSFSTDYFISYKTRLTANLGLLYSYQHSTASSIFFNTTNAFHTGFSVGISHYFL
ncbi:MAG TPA: hypothetical protein VNT20_11070 [Flavisolibacter sp.]|nr:hypothetical protein [Flavisolibacter sp.]